MRGVRETPTKEGKSRGCTLAGAIKHKDNLYVGKLAVERLQAEVLQGRRVIRYWTCGFTSLGDPCGVLTSIPRNGGITTRQDK